MLSDSPIWSIFTGHNNQNDDSICYSPCGSQISPPTQCTTETTYKITDMKLTLLNSHNIDDQPPKPRKRLKINFVHSGLLIPLKKKFKNLSNSNFYLEGRYWTHFSQCLIDTGSTYSFISWHLLTYISENQKLIKNKDKVNRRPLQSIMPNSTLLRESNWS